MTLLLPARVPIAPQRVYRSDRRLDMSALPYLLAQQTARRQAKLALLDAIPDTDCPAPVYIKDRSLPAWRRSATEWIAPAPLIPVSAMVVEPPSVWHSSRVSDKRMVYAERNGVPVQPRTGTDALHVAASKLPQRKTAEQRQAEIFGRAKDAFWDGFNKRKEQSNVGF